MVHKVDGQNFGFDDYDQYKIIEFGHSLRNKLIERWNVLGQEEYIEETELIRRTDRAQQIVNIIIGKNYVPPFPIFLVTILQTIEANNPHNLRYSSYGYYYDVLITQALGKIDKKPEPPKRPLSNIDCILRKTGTDLSVTEKTRSTKSGPGKFSISFFTVFDS